MNKLRLFIKKIIKRNWFSAFIVMCASALVFGFSTYNLFFLFKANITLISEHGYAAVMEGALRQLFELILSGVMGIISYIIFKACEKVLVEKLLK